MKAGEKPTTVVLVDNHELMAASLAEVMRSRGFEAAVIDATALDLEAVFSRLDELRSHAARIVALIDLNLSPVIDGVDLVAPFVERSVPVGILSGVKDRLRLARAVEAGALALLDKAQPLEPLLEAVEILERGEPVLSSSRREDLLAELEEDRRLRQPVLAALGRLSRREAVVLQRLVDGLTAEEIAENEHVSLHTVRSQIRAVLLKLAVHSQHEAVKLAREARWQANEHLNFSRRW